MRVWIDCSNSPHPLLFAPVARRLEEDGHEIFVTARDHAQTAELAMDRWPHATVIGGDSPKRRLDKARTLGARIKDLRAWAKTRRVDIALSHNSYAQIVAAHSLQVPIVTAMDFEHQPANHLAFRLAGTILLPEALPPDAVRKQGAAPSKVLPYPGLKEELYLGDFKPDPGVVDRLGLDLPPGTALVVVRTPPSRAAYHRFENPLFLDTLKVLGAQPRVRCVALVRHAEQRAALRGLELDNLAIPDTAVDSRSLMYAADLMIGAGGTMTREAALLGVPTLSAFAGRAPAVDQWLEAQGRLARMTSPVQASGVSPRVGEPVPLERLRARGDLLLEHFLRGVVDDTSVPPLEAARPILAARSRGA